MSIADIGIASHSRIIASDPWKNSKASISCQGGAQRELGKAFTSGPRVDVDSVYTEVSVIAFYPTNATMCGAERMLP